MRIRQIALVAEKLDSVVTELCSVLDLEVGFRDPGVAEFGLHNAVIPIGDTFLEVVSPTREGTTAGRLLERRHGDGGYMVLLQSEDLQADRKRLAELNVRIVWEIELEDIAAIHLHPKDVGGAIVSMDVPDPPSSWRWGGPEWQTHRRTETTESITGVEIQSDDPDAMAARWADVVGYPVIEANGGVLEIPLLDEGCIRFVETQDPRGDGISALELKVRSRSRVLARAAERGIEVRDGYFEIGGTRIDLRD
jgi:hypothetical protein